METITEILIRRDGLTEKEALDLIREAREALTSYLEDDDIDSAEDICQEYFGLEYDYIYDLL